MAVADAFIACWYAKYGYNLLRPVTYIQAFIDADWLPILVTPPFPEYTGRLYRRAGRWQDAESHLALATTLYREMNMTLLAGAGGRVSIGVSNAF